VAHWQLTAEILREIHADDGSATVSIENRLVNVCAERLPAAGAAIVWMSDSAEPLIIAATDGVGRSLEDIQFTLGEGPHVSCSSLRRAVLNSDLETQTVRSWSGFTREALSLGVKAAFAFPLNVGSINLGVLDIYRVEAGYLSNDQLSMALAFAEAATTVLLRSGDSTEPGSLPPGFEAPFLLHAEVHQATGMIAVQCETDLRTALVMLRARAFSDDRPVIDVARDVVSRLKRFE